MSLRNEDAGTNTVPHRDERESEADFAA